MGSVSLRYTAGEMLRLPAPVAPFFGRQREMALAAASLRRPGVRLVTLTGPPGIGKTALALQVGRRLASRFPDGAALIPLAGVRDAALVPSAIASALGISEERAGPAAGAVGAWLAPRRVLLVVDNFEQVIEAAPLLVGWLEQAPRATCLVTSREALVVRGEYEIPVPPLPLVESSPAGTSPGVSAPSGEPRSQAADLDSAAVRLFCERARAVDPRFRLTDGNAAAVIGVCRRLDGIPLALELAASRIRVQPLESLLAAIEDAEPSAALAALGEGGRDAPARHRTLWAAIDWSYRMLSDGERRLFRALGTFAGSWTPEALASLLAATVGAGPDPSSSVEALAARSLVFRVSGRWSMLQPIRAFASAQLRAAPAEWQAAYEWHLRHALELATAPVRVELEALDGERDNFGGLLEWTVAEARADQGLQLGAALWPWWLARGRLFEGRRWLERLLALDETAAHDAGAGDGARLRVAVLRGAATLARQQGDLAAASRHAGAELTWLRATPAADGDGSVAIAACCVGLARVRVLEGRPEPARALLDEALPELRRNGSAVQLAEALTVGAMLSTLLGRHAAAVEAMEEAVAVQRTLGDPALEGDGLATLALMLVEVSEIEGARAAANQALDLLQRVAQPRGIAKAAAALASVALAERRFSEADALGRRALALLDQLGERMYGSLVLVNLGLAASGRGRHQLAARLAGAAHGFSQRSGYAMVLLADERHRRLVQAARSSLPAAAYERAWSEGLTLRPADVLADEPVEDPSKASTDAVTGSLSRREREVLAELAWGLSDAEVAESLSLSVRTVHAHLRSIYRKLGVANRTAAVRLAIESGLVAVEPQPDGEATP